LGWWAGENNVKLGMVGIPILQRSVTRSMINNDSVLRVIEFGGDPQIGGSA
jgi:hypothetical protein